MIWSTSANQTSVLLSFAKCKNPGFATEELHQFIEIDYNSMWHIYVHSYTLRRKQNGCRSFSWHFQMYFLKWKMCEVCLRFHWILFLWFDLIICQHWFRNNWLGTGQATSHYLNQWWPSILSLCNHVTLYGLASPRLLHSLIDHIKTSHSFKHGYSNGRWVVLYALVSPQWSHAWFRGRVRTILLPATKLYPCVNKLGGSM